ncbi:MAG: hypothetical protein HYY17_10410 [Planctomycetes bacterium]|nr:hypothetical protein [Planctomycetota bacterium]
MRFDGICLILMGTAVVLPMGTEDDPKFTDQRSAPDAKADLSATMDAETKKAVEKQLTELKAQMKEADWGTDTNKIRDEGRIGFNFPSGLVVGLTNGPAVHALAKAFARQVKIGSLEVDVSTKNAAGEALKTEVSGSLSRTVSCTGGRDSSGGGQVAVVIASFGTSKMMDPLDDEDLLVGLYKWAKNVDWIPGKWGEVLKWLYDKIDFSANIKSRAESTIQAKIDGTPITAHTKYRARLIRIKEDAETLEKDIDDDKHMMHAANRVFTMPHTTEVNGWANGEALAKGFGRATSEASTLYVVAHFAICKHGDQRYIGREVTYGYFGMKPEDFESFDKDFRKLERELEEEGKKQIKKWEKGEEPEGVSSTELEKRLAQIVKDAMEDFEKRDKKDDKKGTKK